MANHKSAIKKTKQDIVRQARNKAYKTRYKTIVKDIEATIASASKDVAEKALQEAVSGIDKLVSKGIIHKNKAARKKSRLFKRLHKVETPVSAA